MSQKEFLGGVSRPQETVSHKLLGPGISRLTAAHDPCFPPFGGAGGGGEDEDLSPLRLLVHP